MAPPTGRPPRSCTSAPRPSTPTCSRSTGAWPSGRAPSSPCWWHGSWERTPDRPDPGGGSAAHAAAAHPTFATGTGTGTGTATAVGRRGVQERVGQVVAVLGLGRGDLGGLQDRVLERLLGVDQDEGARLARVLHLA